MTTVQWIDGRDLELKWRTFANRWKAHSFAEKLAGDEDVLDVEVID